MPELERRNQDLRQLVCGLNLQLDLGLPDQPRPAVPLLHHHTFLLGDLNYRLQVTGRHCHHHQHHHHQQHHHHSRQPPPHRLHLPRLQPPGAAKLTKSVKGREQLAFYDSVVGWARGGQWDRLLEHDQLLSATGLLDEWGGPDRHPLATAAAAADPEKPVLSVSETRRATKFLYGWREGALQFAPTYSLLIGERLSYKPNRMPSYCDRILSYSAAGHDRQLALLSYASSDTLRSSDHAPVAAAYALTVADAHVPTGILSPPVGGAALGPSHTWRLQLVGLSARLASPPSAASAGSPLLPSSSGALSLFASACGPLFGRQAPCSAVVATERAAGAASGDAAWWRDDQLSAVTLSAGPCPLAALRDALLVIVLRDAELYGEDDIVATATVTLLGLPAAATADAATLAFRADLIHATERVGEVRGALALARTSAV